MSQVIVFNNPNGGVSICIPTGEVPIEEVLQKDCPAGAIIVDSSTIPQGSDALFQSAWVLNGSKITVNIASAQTQYLVQYNFAAIAAAQIRSNNTAAGIPNSTSDSVWQSSLATDRASIAAATTTAQLVAIAIPTSETPDYSS